ncbi:MAG: hypothetical protein K5981_01195 [Clostridia bacterium]|nr:hypothetical protein [Clostridia bacterium]
MIMIFWHKFWYYLAHEVPVESAIILGILLVASGFALESILCSVKGAMRVRRVSFLAVGAAALYRVIQLLRVHAWNSSIFPWAFLMQMLPLALLSAGIIAGLKLYERRDSITHRP